MVVLTVRPEPETAPTAVPAPAAQGTQMRIHWDLSDAERRIYDAAYWVRDHGAAFKALMAFMHRQVDAGNPCTTRDDALAYARGAHLGVSLSADLKRDHNLYAALTRFMVMLRPRLARTIRFRESEMDKYDMAVVWHEVVNAGTFFLARDRKEAQRLVEENAPEAV